MTSPDDREAWIRLPWDSYHFGISIGRLLPSSLSAADLEKALRTADSATIRCLYWLSEEDESQLELAQQEGFKKVDVRVQLGLDLDSRSHPADEVINIRTAAESDLGPLRALASRSHRNTRFYTDGAFPAHRADALYAAWIERSFHDPSQQVFVCGLLGEPTGYIASRVSGTDVGVIGLIAVEESSRGKGLGAALVRRAIRWFSDREVNRAEVTTQGNNQAAQRLYEGLGFETTTTSVWLHRWLENLDPWT